MGKGLSLFEVIDFLAFAGLSLSFICFLVSILKGIFIKNTENAEESEEDKKNEGRTAQMKTRAYFIFILVFVVALILSNVMQRMAFFQYLGFGK